MINIFHNIRSFLLDKNENPLTEVEDHSSHEVFKRIDYIAKSKKESPLTKAKLLKDLPKLIQKSYSFYSYLENREQKVFLDGVIDFALKTNFVTTPKNTITPNQVMVVSIDIMRVLCTITEEYQKKIISVMLYPSETISPTDFSSAPNKGDIIWTNGFLESGNDEIAINIIKNQIYKSKNFYTQVEDSLNSLNPKLKSLHKMYKTLEVYDHLLDELENLFYNIGESPDYLLRKAAEFDKNFLALHRAISKLSVNKKEKEEFVNVLRNINNYTNTKTSSIEKIFDGYFLHLALPSVMHISDNMISNPVLHETVRLVGLENLKTMVSLKESINSSPVLIDTEEKISQYRLFLNNHNYSQVFLSKHNETDNYLCYTQALSDYYKVENDIDTIYNNEVIHKKQIFNLFNKSRAEFALRSYQNFVGSTSEAFFSCPSLLKETFPDLHGSYMSMYNRVPQTDVHNWSDSIEERRSFLKAVELTTF